MAEVEIRLVVDKSTGKKDVIITYVSDEDALPIEHEDAHRRIVDRLIEGGALKAADLGQIIISRELPARPQGTAAEAPAAVEQTERERATAKR
ncbi:MAG: hypothetical protein U0271_20195 [Polyangiaceae bacterium]